MSSDSPPASPPFDGQTFLRPAESADSAFLLELYAESREAERPNFPGDSAAWAEFVTFQFQVRERAYAQMFPEAGREMICRKEGSIGTVFIHRGSNEIRVVDLALSRAFCRKGIGTALLRRLISESVTVDKPLRLHVLHGDPAQLLYQKLGFATVGENGCYDEMERAAAPLAI